MKKLKRKYLNLGKCYKCKSNLIKVIPKSNNSLWKFKLVCSKCHVIYSGKEVKGNEPNPFYYSKKSKNIRDIKLKEYGYKSYQDYLNSSRWFYLKIKYLKNCIVCGKQAELHHRTYKNFGREMKKDLISLCREHHQYAHYKPTNKSLRNKTYL